MTDTAAAAAAHPPLILGHRGASHAFPDNTMAAFEGALAEGADGAECDVQITADGVLVLFHDQTLPDGQPVYRTGWDRLHRRFPRIPTLYSFLAWRREKAPGFHTLVELKDPDAAMAVADALAPEPATTTVLGGFNGPALAAAKQRHGTLRTSLMVGTVVDADLLIALARRYHCSGVHPCWEARARTPSALITRDTVATLHGAELSVTLWHEERPEELVRLLALGADALCTDTPGRSRALIQAPSRTSLT